MLISCGLESTGLLGDLGASQFKIMKSVCAEARDLYIVSYCKSLRTVNRIIDDAVFYYLALWDKAPYLTFNPWVKLKVAILDEDIFAKLGCELHEIYRRLKRKFSHHFIKRLSNLRIDAAQEHLVYRIVGQYSNHNVRRCSVSGLVGGDGRLTVSLAKLSERSMMGNCSSFILMRMKSLEMLLKT